MAISYDSEGKNLFSNLLPPPSHHSSPSCCRSYTLPYQSFGSMHPGPDPPSNSTTLYPSYRINKAELNVIPVIFILVCVGLWPRSCPPGTPITPIFTLQYLSELMKDQIKSSSSPVHSSASPSMCSTYNL